MADQRLKQAEQLAPSRFGGLRAKLTLAFSLIFAATLALTYLAAMYGLPLSPFPGRLAQERGDALANLDRLADLNKSYLLSWIMERRNDITLFAGLRAVSVEVEPLRRALARHPGRTEGNGEGGERLRDLFDRVVKVQKAYLSLSLADKRNGTVLISTDPAMQGRDISGQPYFSGALRTRSTYVGDLAVRGGSREPVLHFSSVVRELDGRITAVLVLEVAAADILKSLLGGGRGNGPAGEVILLNRGDVRLTSLTPRAGEAAPEAPGSGGRRNDPELLAAGGEEGLMEGVDATGAPVLAAFRHVRVSSETGWGLVVQRRTAELFAPLREEMLNLALIALAALVLVVALAAVTAQKLTGSIRELSRAANRIAGGDPEARAEVDSRDEIGQLAHVVNHMVGRLRQWQRELEEQVKARTADLRVTNQELQARIIERDRSQGDLRESEERFRQLVENIHEVFWIRDLRTKEILYISPAYEEIWGRSLDSLRAKPDSFLEAVHPEDLPRIQAAYQRQITQAEPYEVEYRVLRPDGSQRWVAARASIIKDRQGKPYRAVGLAEDITSRRLAEEAKDNLEDQLRQAQKMEAVGTLAGGVAHDFNNILGVILGYAELGLKQARQGGDNSRELERICQASERARKLVQQMLTFSRKVEMEFRPLNLNQEIKEVVDILERTLPKMTRIETSLAPDLDLINADPGQMELLLLNLATNAQDAMPEGGRLSIASGNETLDSQGQAWFQDIPPGQYVVLEVADTGQGMDSRTLEQVFDPFFTTKGPGKGTGLGLSTVYGIVKGHGGHIFVHSEPGRGATFKLYFPALSSADFRSAAERPAQHTATGGSETVMLVDDDANLREMTAQVLEDAGYYVLHASSGEEALDRYAVLGHKPDLIILDLGMPGMGGRKCLRELLAHDPAARVLIISGYAMDARVKETLALGAAGFLPKPYGRLELLAMIREVLDRRA
jgi:PAS domain S-box-containing protein